MDILQAWLFLGFAVERLTEFIIKMFPVLEKKEIKAIKVPTLISFLLALLITLGTEDLDLFKMVNLEYSIPFVGQVLTALFTAGGSDLIHKILKKLEKKEK